MIREDLMTRFHRLWPCLAVLLIAALPVAAQQKASTDPAPRMEAAEAKRLVDKGEALLVDVRSKEAWDASHADGSVSVPLDQVATRLKELPKDKLIAAYCTCPAEQTSLRAAQILLENGYTKVAAVKGGLNAWEKAGGKIVRP